MLIKLCKLYSQFYNLRLSLTPSINFQTPVWNAPPLFYNRQLSMLQSRAGYWAIIIAKEGSFKDQGGERGAFV